MVHLVPAETNENPEGCLGIGQLCLDGVQLRHQHAILLLKTGDSRLNADRIHPALGLGTFQLLAVGVELHVSFETAVARLWESADEGNEVVPDLGDQGLIQLGQVAELVNELGVAGDAERRMLCPRVGVSFEDDGKMALCVDLGTDCVASSRDV